MKRKKQPTMAVKWGAVMIIFLIGMGIWMASGSKAVAADFPKRPIIVIIPYGPGGGSETETRNIAPYVQKYLGQPIILKTMPGAGTTIGTTAAARAKADGYTLLCTVLPPMILAEKKLKTKGDVANREYIYGWSEAGTSLAVKADSPFKTFADMLAASKKKPLKASVAGIASYTHLSNALVDKYTGLNTKIIPYKGGGPSAIAMIRGDVDFSSIMTTTVVRFVRSGQARALAIVGPKRVDHLPGVPTLAELGYKGIPYAPMARGISAPKGTPADRLKILTTAFKKAVADQGFLDIMKKQGRPVTKLSREKLTEHAQLALKLAEEYLPLLTSE